MSMTRSSKPNLRHLNRSLTIRHFFTPPMACSTRIRKLDIFLFPLSLFVSQLLALGFLQGHLHGHVSRGMPLEAGILPPGNSPGQFQWLGVHYFLVVHTSLMSP